MKKHIQALLALLLLAVTPALAQVTPPGGDPVYSAWVHAGTVNITAGVASSRVSISTVPGPVAWICNTGAVAAFVRPGNSSVVAATTDTPIQAGMCASVWAGGATNVAAITGSSTAALVVAMGRGSPWPAGGGGSGGGGGGSTATQAPVAPGAATATKSDLIGCQYNTPDQVFTNGQQGSVGCDQRGGLYVQDGRAIPSASVSSATNVFVVSDTSGYGSISVQVTSAGTASTITYEVSEDGATWFAVIGYIPLASTGAGVSSSTTALVLWFPTIAKQFRARVSTYGSGTVTAQATLRKDTLPRQTMQVGISGTPTVTGGVADGAAVGQGLMIDAEGRSSDKTSVANAQAVRPVATLEGQLFNIPGATANALGGIAPNATSAAASNLVAKSGAGNLYSVDVTAGATSGYVMIFDATAAPADGAVTPKHCWPLGAGTALARSFNGGPAAAFTTGITAVFSTTGCFTKTASATAFISASAK